MKVLSDVKVLVWSLWRYFQRHPWRICDSFSVFLSIQGALYAKVMGVIFAIELKCFKIL